MSVRSCPKYQPTFPYCCWAIIVTWDIIGLLHQAKPPVSSRDWASMLYWMMVIGVKLLYLLVHLVLFQSTGRGDVWRELDAQRLRSSFAAQIFRIAIFETATRHIVGIARSQSARDELLRCRADWISGTLAISSLFYAFCFICINNA